MYSRNVSRAFGPFFSYTTNPVGFLTCIVAFLLSFHSHLFDLLLPAHPLILPSRRTSRPSPVASAFPRRSSSGPGSRFTSISLRSRYTIYSSMRGIRNGANLAGTKRTGGGRSSAKKDKVSKDPHCEQMMKITNGNCEENGNNEEPVAAHKRPKRAAACSSFKEKSVELFDKSSYVEVKKNKVEDEMVAVDLTKLGPEDLPPCRKLVDFILHDAEGNSQFLEMSEIDDCFITSLIMPMDDNLEREKDKGVKCEGFGRIENWSISGYDEGSPTVWISTENADYECVKPAGSYKKVYDLFYEKARICIEVYRKLARSVGGNPDMSLDELLAGVMRSMSGDKKLSGGLLSRDFVISLGEFIYNQLIGLDETSESHDVHLASLPALLALKDECQNRAQYNSWAPAISNGRLKINEGGNSNSTENEDEKLARLLQEEEDWKLLRQQNGCRGTNFKNFYIKISEAEIANDYPLPAFYRPAVQEMDEYILSEADFSMSYHDLPRRILSNWALYNSDARLISLELIPMKPCAEVDVTVFGSGYMREDDGSGYFQDSEPIQYSSSTSNSIDEGIPIYLGSIKEWMIEFGSSMIIISIRTDVAWYRLAKPTKQYAPWYETVLKTARLAVAIFALLKEQSRVSRLSFTDVIRKVSEFDKSHPAYVSSNLESVERYIVVHGQIILQQFAEYPDKTIKKSAFITGLSDNMEQRLHTKLAMKKKIVVQKEANLNPSAAMGPPLSKRKAMRATTTRLVNKIWGDYYTNFFPEDNTQDGDVLESKENEDDQDENEDEDDESVPFQEEQGFKQHSLNRSRASKSGSEEIKWEDDPTGRMDSGEFLHSSAFVHGHAITVGGAMSIEADDSEEVPIILFLEYMFEHNDGRKMVHGRILKRGYQTILGNAADERELFLTHDCLEIELGDVKSVTIDIRSRSWGHNHRKEHADADKIDRARAEERKKKGLPVEYFCKNLYCPEKGGFFTLPYDSLGLGNGTCSSCKLKAPQGDDFSLISTMSFIFKNEEYSVHDFFYIRHQFLNEDKEEDCGTFKAGRNVGLKPYTICQLLEIQVCADSQQVTPRSTQLKIRRYYRPDDVSTSKAYNSDIREIYYSEEISTVHAEAIEGKCEIQKKSDILCLGLPVAIDHIFFCEYSYDPIKGSLNQLPANVKLVPLRRKEASRGATKQKGKEKCIEQNQDNSDDQHASKENRLATLDIFAGCGGLSEGLQQAGVSLTKWAIEYEEPAGEAFSHNHPKSMVFVDNCNVILRAIMEKCGDLDDCISTSEAAEMATCLSQEKLKNLPMPGDVDFINGGPPCQGFSGMNRFNHGTWSKVQCEMILAFLSFAEYFRPKYFLLENVRNFVSFNKGQTFRLTLASLLAMGYQVRFGILEAGAFGVSQSRKRAFIWAASPEEILPEWPEPMHVFAGSELKVCLPGDSHYAAARSTSGGAPFRSITVRDTIGDLPPVLNGASKPTIDYGSGPISWFQKQIRGNMMVLNDHISKEMNELNLIRCQHIPKLPGADWRDLPDEKVKLSTGQLVDIIPWCLPNTAKRHNQWKGLFGRLDWEGNFPTSITDPQPMGKVGMCFHPDQDRILTVRECARSQGFPDSYVFCGNIQSKHRQIGNAVPPPLAYALGRKLKEAVKAKSRLQLEDY